MTKFEQENQIYIKKRAIMPISVFNQYLNGRMVILTREQYKVRWWEQLQKSDPKLIEKHNLTINDYTRLVCRKIAFIRYDDLKFAEIIKEELGITVFECRWIYEDKIEIIFE